MTKRNKRIKNPRYNHIRFRKRFRKVEKRNVRRENRENLKKNKIELNGIKEGKRYGKVIRRDNISDSYNRNTVNGLMRNIFVQSNLLARERICLKRKVKRAVMFAMGKAGFGKKIKGKRIKNIESKVRC